MTVKVKVKEMTLWRCSSMMNFDLILFLLAYSYYLVKKNLGPNSQRVFSGRYFEKITKKVMKLAQKWKDFENNGTK
jgi:hypothetical protein